MTECCVCKAERVVAVQRFPLLREGYPMGADCCAAWRQHAQSLGGDIYNPARVQVAFRGWLEARQASLTKPAPRPDGWWRALLAEGLRLARGER